MIETMLTALQRQWERDSTWTWVASDRTGEDAA
jgi:hypothetical protein